MTIGSHAPSRDLVLDLDNTLWVSATTVWELAIKASLAKLELSRSARSFIESQRRALGFRLLPIQAQDAMRVERLPWHHRDPFDRLLVAQALNRELAVITHDQQFGDYDVEVVWK